MLQRIAALESVLKSHKHATGSSKHPVKRLEKKLGEAVLKGHGDYRPTKFNRVKGAGDYSSSLGSLGHAVGSGVGSLVDVGKGFASLLGFGDYRTRSAGMGARIPAAAGSESAVHESVMGSLMNPDSLSMGAMSVQFGGSRPRVTHREYISDVVGTTDFTTTVYRIQPGLSGTSTLFPWLSSVAGCFQQYVLKGMIIYYVSTSTDLSTAVNLGSVMMCTQYDANAQPLATELAVNNNEFTTVEKPSRNFIHPIECASSASPTIVRYVRVNNANPTTVSDDRLDDVGVFQLSTVGCPNNGATIGQLWVAYDVEFLKPALPDIHVGTTWLGNVQVAGSINNLSASTLVVNSGNSLPLSVVLAGLFSTSLQINMPVGYNGNYVIIVSVSCYPETSGASILTTSGVGSTGGGSDVSYLNILTSAETPPGFLNSALSGSGSGIHSFQSVTLLSFSTIADTAANNYITCGIPGVTSVSSGDFINAVDILVVPLDNDISSPASVMVNGVLNARAVNQELIDLRKQVCDLLALANRAKENALPPPSIPKGTFISASAPPPLVYESAEAALTRIPAVLSPTFYPEVALRQPLGQAVMASTAVLSDYVTVPRSVPSTATSGVKVITTAV